MPAHHASAGLERPRAHQWERAIDGAAPDRGYWAEKCTAASVKYSSAHDWHAPLAQAFPLASLVHVP